MVTQVLSILDIHEHTLSKIICYYHLPLIFLSTPSCVETINPDTNNCTDKYHCYNNPGYTPRRPIATVAVSETINPQYKELHRQISLLQQSRLYGSVVTVAVSETINDAQYYNKFLAFVCLY